MGTVSQGTHLESMFRRKQMKDVSDKPFSSDLTITEEGHISNVSISLARII